MTDKQLVAQMAATLIASDSKISHTKAIDQAAALLHAVKLRKDVQ